MSRNNIPEDFNYTVVFVCLFPVALRPNAGHGLLIFLRFLDHTQRRTTVGRTPLDEWSARRRDRYLTTHNTHNRKTSMPPVGFKPKISVSERPQTYALGRAATAVRTSNLPPCEWLLKSARYKSLLLYRFYQHPDRFSILGPNMKVITLFSSTFSLSSP